MKKTPWDLYAPIYEKAMRSDRKMYQFMYDRIPKVIKDKRTRSMSCRNRRKH